MSGHHGLHAVDLVMVEFNIDQGHVKEAVHVLVVIMSNNCVIVNRVKCQLYGVHGVVGVDVQLLVVVVECLELDNVLMVIHAVDLQLNILTVMKTNVQVYNIILLVDYLIIIICVHYRYF